MTRIATSFEIIGAIGKVVGEATRPIALHEPYFGGNENAYVKSCIDSGWVSSAGEFVNRFERELAAYCDAKYAVVMVNGTCAIHAALLCLGIKPGDEVLIPSFTFVATANAVMHVGAIPHFIDSETTSLGVDPVALQNYLLRIATTKTGRTINKITGRPIRALMPVHIFGHPCQLDLLVAIAQEWNLELLEDATEALGSRQHGKPVGSRHTAVFSFNGNKIITTGGGGAVTTQDEALYRRLKHLSSTAKQPHAWSFVHDEVAYNYRLPNINAALGCAQLEQMPRFLNAKRALAIAYMDAFEQLQGLRILPSPPDTESNYWLVTLVADQADISWLDGMLHSLHQAGLQCRPSWQPLHLLPMYRHHPRSDLQHTESLARRIINLPSSVSLGLQFLVSEAN